MLNRIWIFLLALGFLSFAGCNPRSIAPSAAADPTVLDRLLLGMQQRLTRMHAVAREKWNAKAPIFDPQREQALLKDVVERGQSYHLDPKVTRAFFNAQMEAAKLLQEDDFGQWRAGKQLPVPQPNSNLGTLRLQIDLLNRELLESLAQVGPFLGTPEGQKRLDVRAPELFADFPTPVRDAALRPLRR
jgi:chorismate mutase